MSLDTHEAEFTVVAEDPRYGQLLETKDGRYFVRYETLVDTTHSHLADARPGQRVARTVTMPELLEPVRAAALAALVKK